MFTVKHVIPSLKQYNLYYYFDLQEELQGSRKLSSKKKSLLEKSFFVLKYGLFAAVLNPDPIQIWIQNSDPKNRKHRSSLNKACRCEVKSVR